MGEWMDGWMAPLHAEKVYIWQEDSEHLHIEMHCGILNLVALRVPDHSW